MKAEETELLKEFTAEQVAKLNSIIEKFKGKPGGLIPVLEEAQVALEFIPISVQKRIASGLNLPLSRVYGVVTFYSFFTMTPRGKHTVRVCLGTACPMSVAARQLRKLSRKHSESMMVKPLRIECSLWKLSVVWVPAVWALLWWWMKTSMGDLSLAKLKKF